MASPVLVFATFALLLPGASSLRPKDAFEQEALSLMAGNRSHSKSLLEAHLRPLPDASISNCQKETTLVKTQDSWINPKMWTAALEHALKIASASTKPSVERLVNTAVGSVKRREWEQKHYFDLNTMDWMGAHVANIRELCTELFAQLGKVYDITDLLGTEWPAATRKVIDVAYGKYLDPAMATPKNPLEIPSDESELNGGELVYRVKLVGEYLDRWATLATQYMDASLFKAEDDETYDKNIHILVDDFENVAAIAAAVRAAGTATVFDDKGKNLCYACIKHETDMEMEEVAPYKKVQDDSEAAILTAFR